MRAALLAAGVLCSAPAALAAEPQSPAPESRSPAPESQSAAPESRSPDESRSPAPDARAIVLEALERAAGNVEAGVEIRYRSRMTREVRRYDGDGRVEEVTTGDYEVIPIDGARYERRLTIDGRPLDAEERAREREREADFREARRRAGEGDDEPDEEEIVFDEALVARYDVAFEAEEVFRGRPSYRISFEPRPGRLPVQRRIDYALNKARGQIWIDKETFEAARVEFELIDRVRLWWGIVGTIMRARGSVDRGPVLDDIWGNLQLETYSDVRILLSRRRRADIRRWHDHELIRP